MTSFLIRRRPRHATAHIRVRVAHAVLGAVAGVWWLVLPVTTAAARAPVPPATAAGRQDGTSVADLVLPFTAVAVVLALAGYGRLRRTRRARTRTTPGTVPAPPPAPGPAGSERQARAALRLADDCVRTSREELSFVRERFGEQRTEPFTHALRAAETELAAAFAIWRRYEQGLPQDPGARQQALAGVIGRCAEAGRHLDARAPELDRLRGFGAAAEGLGAALVVAEGRFRELTARTVTAQHTLADLRERYAPSATASVSGYVEQAKDRLVFATTRLNEARQAADAGDPGRAVGRLRAGEGAVAQAELLVDGVERLAARLREAAALAPAARTEADTRPPAPHPTPAGPEPHRPADAETEAPAGPCEGARVPVAGGGPGGRDVSAGGVREEPAAGPGDPLDVLRRAAGRAAGAGPGVLEDAALLVARCALAGAEEFVAVHRGAVGVAARARLAEAARELGAGHAGRADAAARQTRELAERDVRAYGTPYAGPDGDTAGLAGALLGGILLPEFPDAGTPAAFGGPTTRSRHHA
ncbi:hypothetical protein ACH4PW_26065 [Streptomyces sp. NPDC017082]|uniref:hypothetical protein n=1 Tax=Streptomyces sp. NPDC017082 TaxID=3364974 RepID=UPI0037914E23